MQGVKLKPHISVKLLRNLIEYVPDSGGITWKVSTSKRLKPGSRAGYIRGPYYTVQILGQRYYSHTVVWALCKGYWAKGMIDHINGNGYDNRIGNLREATPSQNQYNRPSSRGYSRTRVGHFHTSITIDKRRVSLGTYRTAKEARAVYLEACKQLHGEFAQRKIV